MKTKIPRTLGATALITATCLFYASTVPCIASAASAASAATAAAGQDKDPKFKGSNSIAFTQPVSGGTRNIVLNTLELTMMDASQREEMLASLEAQYGKPIAWASRANRSAGKSVYAYARDHAIEVRGLRLRARNMTKNPLSESSKLISEVHIPHPEELKKSDPLLNVVKSDMFTWYKHQDSYLTGPTTNQNTTIYDKYEIIGAYGFNWKLKSGDVLNTMYGPYGTYAQLKYIIDLSGRFILDQWWYKVKKKGRSGKHASIGVATQSSTDWGGLAARAIDGNTNGDYNGANSTTHTRTESNPWWTLDLGTSRDISHLHIWNRTDVLPERLSNFIVFVSNKPFASSDPAVVVADRSVWFYHHKGTINKSHLLPVGRSGRYIRIQIPGGNKILSLAEVEVIETAGVATQSSTDWGGLAHRAIDGITNGDYNGANSTTHTQTESNPWWTLDLGETRHLSGIKIWNRTDMVSERLSDFYVFVSDQPFVSTDPAVLVNSGVWKRYYSGTIRGFDTIPVDTTGRYIRIQIPGQNKILSLAEVEVEGSFIATQSSTGWGGLAHRAIDGNTNGDYNGANSTTHTRTESNPWWTLDLGESKDLSHIKIWNRTDMLSERLSDFTVSVSNQPFSGNDGGIGPKSVSAPWTRHYRGTFKGSAVIPIGVSGRYIRIQIPGQNKILSLAEVEVHEHVFSDNGLTDSRLVEAKEKILKVTDKRGYVTVILPDEKVYKTRNVFGSATLGARPWLIGEVGWGTDWQHHKYLRLWGLGANLQFRLGPWLQLFAELHSKNAHNVPATIKAGAELDVSTELLANVWLGNLRHSENDDDNSFGHSENDDDNSFEGPNSHTHPLNFAAQAQLSFVGNFTGNINYRIKDWDWINNRWDNTMWQRVNFGNVKARGRADLRAELKVLGLTLQAGGKIWSGSKTFLDAVGQASDKQLHNRELDKWL